MEVPIIRGSSKVPPPGTPLGDQVRQTFIRSLLDIGGDTRLLWLPKSGDTTTNTSVDRNARTITYSESVAAFDTAPGSQGSGVVITFNGTDEEGDTPDTANLSFGDGFNDEPFSLYAWVQTGAAVASRTILSKYDATTGTTKREYRLYLDSSGRLTVEIWDDSAAAIIGRRYSTALTVSTNYFIAATYDGSMGTSGIRLYVNAARVDDGTGTTTGTYVAMEDESSLVVRLGFEQGAAATAQFWNGKMYCAGIVAKEFSIDELWAMKVAGNGFWNFATAL